LVLLLEAISVTRAGIFRFDKFRCGNRWRRHRSWLRCKQRLGSGCGYRLRYWLRYRL
jgi:hypothetical protein